MRIELTGAGREPVHLERTINSHGLADLPPMNVDDGGRALVVTLALRNSKPRTVRIERASRRHASVSVLGRAPSERGQAEIETAVRHVLRMDEDLSELYELCAADPDMHWVSEGAGRMIRSQTVFEEVVKTICTTNCTWSATRRMVGAIVGELGERAVGDRRDAPHGHAFPSPEKMASVEPSFYREVARAGYRDRYFVELAASVANGELDLESWGRAGRDELPDGDLYKMLLGLPGVGPYAAAHIMMMMGRYSKLILDSWTRPTFARLTGRKKVTDATIERRFRRYGPYAGLAFWLFLTREWVEENEGMA
jgi:N-glycosylase/DNA lyase